MADQIKVLGQVSDAATGVPANLFTLYTVPSGTQTTISSLVVCHTGSGGTTFTVAVRVKGAPLDKKQCIFGGTTISGNATKIYVMGMTLSDGDIISVSAGADDVTFNLFGVETS